MTAGHQFTVPTALDLLSKLDSNYFQVHFDHGSADRSSQIISWFGPTYQPPLRPKQLAQLDIAVIHSKTGRVITLIEIEDSSSNPKILMSDLLATLLGSGIEITGKPFIVGPWTRFVVFVKDSSYKDSSGKHSIEFQKRINFLKDQVEHIRRTLSTPNAVVQATLDTFIEQKDLFNKTFEHVQQAIAALEVAKPLKGRAPFQVLVYPYRKDSQGELEYALLKRSDAGYWQGVAGGGEDNETPVEAARRETREESGIPEASTFLQLDTICPNPVTDFRDSYLWGNDVYVIPQYFFGVQADQQTIVLSHEHTAHCWVNYDEALSLIKYDGNKIALWELDRKLRGLGPRD